jgi:hypothetical protein
MKFAKGLCTALALAACAGLTTAAKAADTPSFTIGGSVLGTDGNYVLGNQFLVNTNTSVLAVGYYDDGNDGLGTSHDIAFWNDTTNTLVSGSEATVAAGTVDPLMNDFRYVNLSHSINLIAGDTYTEVASDVGTADHYVGITSLASQIPNVTYEHGLYTSGASDVTTTNPTSDFGYIAYGGPNFSIAPVPEASTVVTFALLLVGGGLMLRRKRNQTSV